MRPRDLTGGKTADSISQTGAAATEQATQLTHSGIEVLPIVTGVSLMHYSCSTTSTIRAGEAAVN